jgi:type IV pilus biogenesis protein PilP
MKSRLKTFRWARFLIAMMVTFVAVIAFDKAMAMDASVSGTRVGKAPASNSDRAQSTDTAATASAPVAVNDHGSAPAVMNDPGVLPSGKAASTQSYYHQVDAIRTDTDLVTAQIDNLKVHHELEQARSGVFKSDTPAPTQAGMPMMQMPGMVPSADTSASADSQSPLVEQTAMVDGRWVASIRLPSGGYINNARAGQSVPGVGRILSISLNDVTVSTGKKTYSLPFAGGDSGVGPAASTPQRNGMTIAPPVGIR